METAERRFEMFKYLCRVRYAKISELAERFGVSEKTVSRDVFEIEMTYHITLEVKRGRYGGGVYVTDDYKFGQMYLYDDEIALLVKLQQLTKSKLTLDENELLSHMIKKYHRKAN